jgi:GNAT superfamily N-acetyltransferase
MSGSIIMSRPFAVSDPPKFQIKQATTSTEISQARSLFTEYTAWLDIDLTFQNYASELASLPGLYVPPTGTLLIATSASSATSLPSNSPIGCIALRPLKSRSPIKTCEIKRLYTVPEARGLGVGKALIERVLEEATRLGYEKVVLDTLEGKMEGAVRLYKKMGFEDIGVYYKTPLQGTLFLGRKL